MEHCIENGIYGDSDVWRFYSIEEAETHKSDCSNWPLILRDFKKLYSKVWQDIKDIRFLINNNPIYHEYKIIGLEDNKAWADYYWILEDINGKRKYELANYSDFHKHIIDNWTDF